MLTIVKNEDQFSIWNALKPVYFQKWVWEKAVRHNPVRYSNYLPVYQGQKVILT